jgi:hypothetical protein
MLPQITHRQDSSHRLPVSSMSIMESCTIRPLHRWHRMGFSPATDRAPINRIIRATGRAGGHIQEIAVLPQVRRVSEMEEDSPHTVSRLTSQDFPSQSAVLARAEGGSV